jgi:hypothetical protein
VFLSLVVCWKAYVNLRCVGSISPSYAQGIVQLSLHIEYTYNLSEGRRYDTKNTNLVWEDAAVHSQRRLDSKEV